MIRVNLLAASPGGAKPARVWLPPEHRSALAGIAMLMVTAVGMGSWWYALDHERAAVDLEIANAEADIERLKGAAKLVEYAAARKAELAERINLIDRLRTTERDPVNMLQTVNRSLPDGLWLLDLKQTGPALQLEGNALSITYVKDFAKHLEDSGVFVTPVDDINTKTETVQESQVIRFVLKATAIDKSKPAVPATITGTPATPATSTPAVAAKGVTGG